MKQTHLFWFICLFMALPPLLFSLPASARDETKPADLVTVGPGRRYTERIPVIDLGGFGYRPVSIPADAAPLRLPRAGDFRQGGGSDPQNPYAVIRQTGPDFAAPGSVVEFEIALANYESVARVFHLRDVLPPGLAYVPGSAGGLTYEPQSRTLSWRGELAPGNLDYVIEKSPVDIPYLDLADFKAANLCDDFVAGGEDCDEVAVTFNLGVNGYTTSLYGQTLSQLTLFSNGVLLGDNAAAPDALARNQWLPSAAGPGFLLAGLWRDTNMGGATTLASGRWHAAVVRGLVEGHDVFYAQWHDVPHAADPNLTARYAVVVVLNGNDGLAGHAFFIYDNVSDPARTVALGYTIGIEDRPGLRGATYAYAPCCGDSRPPRGYPPVAGATLHLRPALFGGSEDYRRTFRFAAVVEGRVPETVVNTATATSDSADPALANVWATHYLNVRRLTYLPLFLAGEVFP